MEEQGWQAADLHDLADLLASLVPSGASVDLLDGLEALERIKSPPPRRRRWS